MKMALSRPLIIFYILVIYIVIQFCWWAYHIINLESKIYALEAQQGFSGNISPRVWMVAGEGFVFILLLFVGIIITRNSLKKEIALAARQKNFLLSVTHELKSPVASIKLYLETLLKRSLEKEVQTKIISDTIRETDRLISLVDNLLVSAKIETGNFSIIKESINVSDLAAEIVNISFSSTAPKHKYDIHIEPGIFLVTDKTAFTSIMLNLVENAAKYSPSGTTITVNLRRVGHEVQLSVEDEGMGIPPEERLKIFEKFYRIGNEETRNSKGTGLGLFIVKSLLNQLGGSILVKERVSSGSIFEIRFK